MRNYALSIAATGLVTGVGLDTFSSCAAIRAAIDNFQETRFLDQGGDWIQGCEVPLESNWRGTRKLANMFAMALMECAEQGSVDPAEVPILLCLAEKERPGRPKNLGSKLFFEAQEVLGFNFHPKFELIEHGRVSALVALKKARAMIYQEGHEQVLIAGVDSLLSVPTLREFERRQRVLTTQNSNGFIPGEAASVILVRATTACTTAQLCCTGLGFGMEEATIDSDMPLRADGLTSAVRAALLEAETTMASMDFRIVDVTGEHYWFKETSLVLSRLLRGRKENFALWNPTDCVGEVGAAMGGLMMTYLKIAHEKNFAAGLNCLLHSSNDDSRRGAAVVSYGVIKNG